MDSAVMVGCYVVVRASAAGVHCGTLVCRMGQEVRLANARRIWSWTGAFTLNAVATDGVGEGSRLGVPVELIDILDACEVIVCSTAARLSLEVAGS